MSWQCATFHHGAAGLSSTRLTCYHEDMPVTAIFPLCNSFSHSNAVLPVRLRSGLWTSLSNGVQAEGCLA